MAPYESGLRQIHRCLQKKTRLLKRLPVKNKAKLYKEETKYVNSCFMFLYSKQSRWITDLNGEFLGDLGFSLSLFHSFSFSLPLSLL
jgi:hypothetical protein